VGTTIITKTFASRNHLSQKNFINQDKRYQVNPVVSCGEEEDGAVLYNPDTDNTSVVNLSGLNLWAFLQTPHSTNEIVDYLLQNYSGVSVKQATEDTKLFVETLAPDFLLELNDDNQSA